MGVTVTLICESLSFLKESCYQPAITWHSPCSVCLLLNYIMTIKHSYTFVPFLPLQDILCCQSILLWLNSVSVSKNMVEYMLSSFFSEEKDWKIGSKCRVFTHGTQKVVLSFYLISLPRGFSTSLLKVSVIKISSAAGALPASSNMLYTANIGVKTTGETVYMLYICVCMSREVMPQWSFAKQGGKLRALGFKCLLKILWSLPCQYWPEMSGEFCWGFCT